MAFGEPGAARVLIIGGSPHPAADALVSAARAGCDVVVAVDRGLDVVLRARTGCNLFCGDLDSVSEAGSAAVRVAETDPAACAMEVERYDPRKDLTDLALALRAVDARWPRASIVATCCFGGSPDHLLGVLGLLGAREGTIELVEDGFRGRVLHGGDRWSLSRSRGRRFSFIPLADQAVVSLSGMRWDLDREHVRLLCDLGISNVIECNEASIICHDGALVAWVFSAPCA